MINMIFAMNSKYYIGSNNDLLFSLKKDFKFFKEKTVNNTIVFGYKTFMNKGKPLLLPNRRIIVIVDTTRPYEEYDGIIYVSSILEAINAYNRNRFDDLFFCGGGVNYNLIISKYLDKIDNIYVTLIEDTHIGSVHVNYENIIGFKDTILEQTTDIDRITNTEKKVTFILKTKY